MNKRRSYFDFSYRNSHVSLDTTIQKIEDKFVGERHYSKFEIKCEPGFGHTLGLALRRTALASLPGFAPVALYIEGAKHEFDIVKGIKEQVVEIVLNIKRLSVHTNNFCILSLSKTGPCKVYASDITTPDDVRIINKDLFICTLDAVDANLNIEIAVGMGIGYENSDHHQFTPILGEGFFPIDSVFSSVKEINYTVTESTSGRNAEDIITMDIFTDGRKTPEEAIYESSTLIINKFKTISNEQEVYQKTEIQEEDDDILNQPIENIITQARARNCLRIHGIYTIRDLISKTQEEIRVMEGIGDVSFNSIISSLASYGLHLGSTYDGLSKMKMFTEERFDKKLKFSESEMEEEEQE